MRNQDKNKELGFLQGLDNDLKGHLLDGLTDLWTHHSTAIEGNTLTLSETHFILSEGLTIAGKTLREHNEVTGHARAIDTLYEWVTDDLSAFTPVELFELHRLIQTEQIFDIMRPVGAWKVEPNGTNTRTKDGRIGFHTYTLPDEVPGLMGQWLACLNEFCINAKERSLKELINAYAKLHIGFTSIHPFFDGNGRVARLVSNLPLLKAGYPPIVIHASSRFDYMQALHRYSDSTPTPTLKTGVWPGSGDWSHFQDHCHQQYTETFKLIETIQKEQSKRDHWRKASCRGRNLEP